MSTKVRVPKTVIAVGGWKGRMEIDGDVLKVVGDDPQQRLEIDCSQVKRCSFNSNNGLWAFRLHDGRKVYLQMSGALLSADRSAEGRAATEQVHALLASHGVRGFTV